MQNELLLVASLTKNYLGNGKTNVQFNLIRGEWYRLRVVGVEINGKAWDLGLPVFCETYQVAHDGVWRFNVPKATSPVDGRYHMTPASRMDFAVRCSRLGSYVIQFDNTVVATLMVANGNPTAATPYVNTNQTWSPKRPDYLQDVSTETPDSNYTISLFDRTINGRPFDPSVFNGFLTYGQLQEWTLSFTLSHPYHQHVHHFQVVNCPGHDAGEFYDTVMSTNGSTCLIRFRLLDYSGKLMVHCHNILHSEQGTMAIFNVSEGGIVNSDVDLQEFACIS